MRKDNLIRLLLFGIVFILFSCSEDLFDEQINQNKNLIVRKVSMQDIQFKDNARLVKSVANLKQVQLNSSSRYVYNETYDFYIDEENGVYLKKDSLESYTFPIYKTETDSTVTDIVFKKSITGDYDAILAKYDILKRDLADITFQELLQSNVEFINLIGKYGLPELMCFEEYSYENTNELVGADGPPIYEWTLTGSFCYMQYDNGGGGGDLSNIPGGGIITGPIDSPHGVGGGTMNPCISLKKVNLKIKESLNTLSNSASTEETGEYGYSFQVDNSNNMTQPVDLGYSIHDYIVIPSGSNIYGGAHSHPLDAYYMFSFSDVAVLLNLYSKANTSIKKDVVFILVNPDGSSYAIKIDDINLFIANMQQKLADTGVYGPMESRVKAADDILETKYRNTSIPTDSDKLARAFLEHFNGSGMSLFKSTGNFDGWKKLSLPIIPSSPLLTETPCN